MAILSGSVVKNLPANAGGARDMGLIPGSGRSPKEGNGNLLQCSCLENSMDKEAWLGYSPWDCRIGHDWVISHASKVMLKILQARLQQYVNCELPDFQAGFRKDRGTRDQIANIHWIMEKGREFQKNISALLTMPKPLTVWITINCGKFWKRWEYQTTWPASWETYMQFRKQS